MNKRNVCGSATLPFGLLAIAASFTTYLSSGAWFCARPASMVVGLLSAICGTQWIDYQKRQDAVSARPSWPRWVRGLLY